jgi:sporulation protein YlmC with PRC-barrel domain
VSESDIVAPGRSFLVAKEPWTEVKSFNMARGDPVAFKVIPANVTGMTDVLAENLSGKSVMGSDGTELGMLYNITMDLKTGSLNDLLVSPNEEFPAADSAFRQDEEGRLHVPVSHVQAVKDYIVIDR